jgi:K+-sensing histidine kinase KdpD
VAKAVAAGDWFRPQIGSFTLISKTLDLFDPFFTTKPTGMGMGLSICRTIIETYGGDLRLARTSHRGSSFEITLPIVQQTASRASGGG